MTDQDWWGVAEAASHCGIKPGTWRDYVSDGRAPKAERGTDPAVPPNRWNPQWRPETVKAWHAGRPGKGGRPRRTTAGT